jgi:hypothetical protein
MILPLLLIKVVIAIIGGTVFDLVFQQKRLMSEDSGKRPKLEEDRDEALHHAACCSHEVSDRPSKLRSLVQHPLLHTLKVFAYLLVLTIGINFLFAKLGGEQVSLLLHHGSALQPALASLIGLIPNCFASVALAQLYAEGVLSFGSLISGLCAGAGLGLIVLVRENKSWRNTLLIIASLLAVSIACGMILQLFPGI